RTASGKSVVDATSTPTATSRPPQVGQALSGTGTSMGDTGPRARSGATRERKSPLPGLRPGFLGAATRVPLEKGAPGRWPSRLRRSTPACKAATLAINSAIWWCCARTSFTKSSRLNAVREAGKLMVHDCRLASQFLQAANQLHLFLKDLPVGKVWGIGSNT